MESKDKLKEIEIKTPTCISRYSVRMRENADQNNSEYGNFLRSGCYFDDIIKDADIGSSYILLDEKLYEKISVYCVSYKASTGPKPLRIRFDGFIRVSGGEVRFLVLFYFGLFGKIC